MASAYPRSVRPDAYEELRASCDPVHPDHGVSVDPRAHVLPGVALAGGERALETANVQPTSARGVFFRHVPAGGEPLFQPEHPADGRWQRGGIVEGFYLAGDEQTARAEWRRALAELAMPPMGASHRTVLENAQERGNVMNTEHRRRIGIEIETAGCAAVPQVRMTLAAFGAVSVV